MTCTILGTIFETLNEPLLYCQRIGVKIIIRDNQYALGITFIIVIASIVAPRHSTLLLCSHIYPNIDNKVLGWILCSHIQAWLWALFLLRCNKIHGSWNAGLNNWHHPIRITENSWHLLIGISTMGDYEEVWNFR